MRVNTTQDDGEPVLNGLINALIETPHSFRRSNTRDFKLIPFQDNTIGRDGLTELITQQNELLHSTIAILVVDGGWCNWLFTPKAFDPAIGDDVDQGENAKFSIIGEAMEAITEDR